MSLLGSILGSYASGRRGYGSGGWNRGRTSYGRSPLGFGYGGRSRAASGGFFGSNLGRMAMGGLAAYGLRRFLGSRRPPMGY
ncbi:hypothetical protein [Pyxidicoccus xibeiensis]|uniref:hypothetical protein n=1 Tax=Pyxidicoccus xibeiensis TaxID=2906759 RepID=UPI0020A769A7|nr:hypothetical protein [Pyxidicoccus xibeiensis]MCP3139662.1 hypothetical protein [Pyxidicoccus xibeiensis]